MSLKSRKQAAKNPGEDLNSVDAPSVNAAVNQVETTRKGVFARKRAKKTEEGQAEEKVTQAAPDIPPHMKRFMEVTDENSLMREAIASIRMASDLLKNTLKHGAVDIKKMGFDPEKIRDLMRAIYTLHRGELASESEINGTFRQWDKKTAEIIYGELLDLTENDDEDTIRQRFLPLAKKLDERLTKFMKYMPASHVVATLFECQEADEREYKEDEEPLDDETIIANNHFDGSEQDLGDDEVQAILREYATVKDAEVDATKFFLANHATEPACGSLYSIQMALSDLAHFDARRFKGNSFDQVVDKLDAMFPEIPGLGRQLEMLGATGENVTEILKTIIENDHITDEAVLKARLAEIHKKIARLYPDLLAADDPARVEMEEDLMKVYEHFWKGPDKDKTRPHIISFYHIYNAFSGSEERYDKEYRTTYFGGKTRDQLKEAINARAPGMADAIQQACEEGTSFKTTLIRFVALFRDHIEYNEALYQDVALFAANLASIKGISITKK